MASRGHKVVTQFRDGAVRAEGTRQLTLSIFVPRECPTSDRGTEREVAHRDAVAAARAAFVEALKPSRRGKSRPESFEARGAAVLSAAPPARPALARTMVRLYYTSMGGEELCADFGPYTWQTANRVASELGGLGPPRSNPARPRAVKFPLYEVGSKKAAPPRNMRQVVFPSELPNAFEFVPTATEEEV